MAAASRAAARENERRAKFRAKQEMASATSEAVAEWQERINRLTTADVLIASPIDWQRTANLPEPLRPSPTNTFEVEAKSRLAEFQPRFWDFLQGGSQRKLQKLEQALAEAPTRDQRHFDDSMAKYNEEHSSWQEDTALAKRVLSGKPDAFREVIEEVTATFKEQLWGKSIEFQFDQNSLHAIPTVFGTDIVPKFRRKQLASGRLSETDMPAAQYYGYYQDYVAGIALTVADSILKLLPIEEAYVTCKSEMLNTMTGHKEIMPILSVKVVRQTMENLNLEGIDTSDALRNFSHVMAFKRASGFSEIKPLRSSPEE